jgi:ferric-dicitrate binding protein FerR (iron transport regulator)
MKHDEKNLREFLAQSFEPFRKLPPAQAEPAWRRLQDRLREDPNGTSEDAGVAVGPVSPRRQRSAWLQWPAVAAMAAAIAIAILLPTQILQSAPAVLEDASGSRKIQYGEIVRPSGDTSAMLAMTDGPRVEVRAHSELSVERTDDGVSIWLSRGGVIVEAAGQHRGNVYVQTKDMRASVAGAVSLVKTEEEGSSVAAIGGEVRVQQGATETKVQPGEQVATNPKMDWLPMTSELTWSRQAVTHLAMLGQATRIPTSRLPAPQTPNETIFEEAVIRPAAPPPARGAGERGGGGSGPEPCYAHDRIQLDPRRFSIRDTTLYELVALAYGRCQEMVGGGAFSSLSRLSGGPDWVKSSRWDIEAVIPQGAVQSAKDASDLVGGAL